MLAALAIIAVAVTLSGCSSGSGEAASADSGYPNVDLANTRQAKSSIDSSTVADLAAAWEVPVVATASSYSSPGASPVVADGVVYAQDRYSDVRAIDLESGEVLWKRSYREPSGESSGVTVAGGNVYGATPAGAFALDRETGRQLWSTPLRRNGSETISMAPGYYAGTVYVSTVPADFAGGEVGVLWALDAKTGRKEWSFDTVPRDLWGDPELNFGGGLTSTPAFDERGSMYVSIGIPGPAPGTEEHPWGSSRPGPNLYTNSVVKLDARTGELRWYHQLTPHSICNWALGPPLLLRAGGRDLVVVASRSGVVVALDRQTGEPVWRRPVGRHNGHDDDGLVAMRGEYAKLKTPLIVLPGRYGGVPAPLASDGSTIFVPVVDRATKLDDQRSASDSLSSDGEIVALDAATGAVRWKHRLPVPPLGATAATNDLVFASTSDGRVYALDADSGGEVWTASLPGGTDAGLTVSGSTLLAPAGAAGGGQLGRLQAYRLSN